MSCHKWNVLNVTYVMTGTCMNESITHFDSYLTQTQVTKITNANIMNKLRQNASASKTWCHIYSYSVNTHFNSLITYWQLGEWQALYEREYPRKTAASLWKHTDLVISQCRTAAMTCSMVYWCSDVHQRITKKYSRKLLTAKTVLPKRIIGKTSWRKTWHSANMNCSGQ